MSRRRHVKPVRRSMAVFVGFPKLIEGENYFVIFVLLCVLTIGFLMFAAPEYAFAGLSFDCFLMVVWQIYSGIGLKPGRWGIKMIASYAREREPSLFYVTTGIWFLIGLVALIIFLNIYFAPRQLSTL